MASLQDAAKAASKAKQLANIAKVVAGLKKVQAANTQGLARPSPSGTNRGGSSGAVGAPVSTLASLPQTPELQALIQQGIIREGMPPEQALAIMSISKLGSQVPIDIAALKASVEGNYEKYTGDITGAGADWMKQIMGQNMPTDPAMAALYAQDPLFTGYAGSLAQMDETADTNLATDLAWFDKQQSAYGDYYNSLLAGAQAGTLLPAAAGGGGGGGGGGRRGGGGYGGGGGGGSGTAGDLKTTLSGSETLTDTATDNVMEINPGFQTDMLNYVSQFGPGAADKMEEILNLTESGRGQDVIAALEAEQINMDAQNATYQDVQENNRMWSSQQPTEFRKLLDQYEQMTGLSLGDDPNMPGEQAFHYAERTGDDPRTVDKVEGEDHTYTYSPADTALMQPAQQDEIEELRELLEPALLGATGNNVNDPANISKAANAVGYLQSLARNKVVGNAAGGIAAAVNNARTASSDELVTDPNTGVSSPATNPFAQVLANFTRSGAVVPGQPPGQTSGRYVDPNIIQPAGSEVQNTPENNLSYFEATGTWPWTPATDDPNAGRPQESNIPTTDRTPGWLGAIPGYGPPPLQPNVQQIAQIMGHVGRTTTSPSPNNPVQASSARKKYLHTLNPNTFERTTPRELADSREMGPANPANSPTSPGWADAIPGYGQGFALPQTSIMRQIANAALQNRSQQGPPISPNDPSDIVRALVGARNAAQAAQPSYANRAS